MKLQEQPESSLSRVRPIPITILCVVFLLGGVFLCASNLIPGVMQDLNSKIASWYPSYLVVFSVVTIACAVGLWKMKAWAFVLYGLVAALNQIVMAVAGDWAPSNLILVAVFYFLLFRYFPRAPKQGQQSEQAEDGDTSQRPC